MSWYASILVRPGRLFERNITRYTMLRKTVNTKKVLLRRASFWNFQTSVNKYCVFGTAANFITTHRMSDKITDNAPKFKCGDKVLLVHTATAVHTVTAVLPGAWVATGVKGNAYQLDLKATAYNEGDLVAVSDGHYNQ